MTSHFNPDCSDRTLHGSGMNEPDVLAFHPFQDDFGLPSDRCFSDRIVTARRVGVCHDCAGGIKMGEAQRRAVWLFDGEMRTYRWCSLCCQAMALSWTDNGIALEARAALRRARMAE